MILDTFLNESYSGGEVYDVEPTNNGYDPSLLGAMQIVSESTEEMHRLTTTMGVVDYQSIQLLGESKVDEAYALQESAVGGFFEKLKGIIMKLWKKIKEFFSNVKLYFSKMQNDDKFLKNYKDELNKLSVSGFEYEGFKFGGSLNLFIDENAIMAPIKKHLPSVDPTSIVAAAKKGSEADTTKLEGFLKDKNEVKEEAMKKVKSSIVGEECDNSNWREKALEKLRGGEKEKLSVDTGSIIKTIEGKGKALEAITKEEQKASKSFNDALKYVDKCKTELDKNAGKLDNQTQKNNFNKYTEVLKLISTVKTAALNDVSAAAGLMVQAAKDEVAQARDIAKKLLTHSRKGSKSEKLGESFVGEQDGASIVHDIFSRL